MLPHDLKLDQYRGCRILITGGLGFIGSNLAHRLVAIGAHVTILDHLSKKDAESLQGLAGIEGKINLVVDDIRNIDRLKTLVPVVDVIFNLAGQVSYTDSLADPRRDFDVSCLGQLSLLEACRLSATKARIIFASSRMVYRRLPTLPVAEDEPTEPLTIYGVHKLTTEQYHRLYHDVYGIASASLRITNPYGPRQRANAGKYGLVNWFIKLASRGEPLSIFGDGAQIRDYLYIDDLVEIFLRVALLRELKGQVYNAGRGEGVRFRDMAEAVIAAAGAGSIKYVPWPENYARFETGDFVPDVSRLVADINYSADTSLADGLHQTVAYYRDR